MDKIFFTTFATVKKTVLILLALLLCIPSEAQLFRSRRKKAQKEQTEQREAAAEGQTGVRKVSGVPMFYEVIDGDTVFVDAIDPVWCFPRGYKPKGTDWRKNYRLVYNFNKVYPYALAGRKMMAQIDSTLAADASKRSQRNAYTHDVMMEMFSLFEKDIRNMSVSQGMMLMRLIDRECGEPPYGIIKEYRNGFTAGFWQLVAKLFGADLKKRYEPAGADKDIESLVHIWESGGWDSFYYSIFFEQPKKTVIARERLQSTVKSREDRRKMKQDDEKEKGIMKRALELANED